MGMGLRRRGWESAKSGERRRIAVCESPSHSRNASVSPENSPWEGEEDFPSGNPPGGTHQRVWRPPVLPDRGGTVRHHSRSLYFTRFQHFCSLGRAVKRPIVTSNIYINSVKIAIFGRGRAAIECGMRFPCSRKTWPSLVTQFSTWLLGVFSEPGETTPISLISHHDTTKIHCCHHICKRGGPPLVGCWYNCKKHV